MYKCIGQHRDKLSGKLIRCTHESETPTNAARPEWGWLCETCAATPRLRNSPVAEEVDVGCMQCDPAEFKDSIAFGFTLGVYKTEGDEDD